MLKTIAARIKQGYRTIKYPKLCPKLPDRFRGRPVFDTKTCAAGCGSCASVCPVGALQYVNDKPLIDLGKCLFCGECERSCSKGAITFTREHSMAVSKRDGLIINGNDEQKLADALCSKMLKIFGRSLKLREISAGGCNACEADVNVLTTVVFDLSRFGIDFVASPRHADGILVTGPVTKNMAVALRKTYDAVPDPKIVIAVGACAISGGPFAGHKETEGGISDILPVDLFIPGCPPHPLTILDGLLKFGVRC